MSSAASTHAVSLSITRPAHVLVNEEEAVMAVVAVGTGTVRTGCITCICSLACAFLSVPLYVLLNLTVNSRIKLFRDFALGRSIVPAPHAACLRTALILWDLRAPLDFVKRARLTKRVSQSDLTPVDNYVDALEDPINRDALFAVSIIVESSEGV